MLAESKELDHVQLDFRGQLLRVLGVELVAVEMEQAGLVDCEQVVELVSGLLPPPPQSTTILRIRQKIQDGRHQRYHFHC